MATKQSLGCDRQRASEKHCRFRRTRQDWSLFPADARVPGPPVLIRRGSGPRARPGAEQRADGVVTPAVTLCILTVAYSVKSRNFGLHSS